MSRNLGSALLAAAAAVGGAEGAAAQNAVKVGDRPAYVFQSALVNGEGVKSLADLQGRPVVVEFSGTR